MTAHRPATVTWPALLLLLLAACMPASPVAPASTATLVAPSTRPATLTPTLAPTPAPTPTPLPRPQLSLPDDSLFSPTEQAALQSLISAAPAQWGITADMDLQPVNYRASLYQRCSANVYQGQGATHCASLRSIIEVLCTYRRLAALTSCRTHY